MKNFLTIDFEDFSHDLGKNLNLYPKLNVRINALEKSYEKINQIIKKYSKNDCKKATFFVTGVLADLSPDIISQISKDGHEVACHFYYHEIMQNQNKKNVEKMIRLAKDRLEDVSNSKVIGFRAPYFKINKTQSEQYQIIEKYFKYDSSLCISSINEKNLFYKKMGLSKLILLPVFSDKVNFVKQKTGGTYTKIFPISFLKKMIFKNKRSGLNCINYYHPYEFDNGGDWILSLKDLSSLSIEKRIYWWLRQHQWLSFGNSSLENKINFLSSIEKFDGCLRDLIN